MKRIFGITKVIKLMKKSKEMRAYQKRVEYRDNPNWDKIIDKIVLTIYNIFARPKAFAYEISVQDKATGYAADAINLSDILHKKFNDYIDTANGCKVAVAKGWNIGTDSNLVRLYDSHETRNNKADDKKDIHTDSKDKKDIHTDDFCIYINTQKHAVYIMRLKPKILQKKIVAKFDLADYIDSSESRISNRQYFARQVH